MPSQSTRAEIVLKALKQAGRGVELKSHVNGLLNDLLRDWAYESKHPILRKFGDELTLLSGQWTLSLPSDLGAGMDKILLGTERKEIEEKDPDEFLACGGYPQSNAGTGRPLYYTLDEEAGLFRFNQIADQNYPVVPIYFRMPDPIDTASSGDDTKVWHPNDDLVIQALVQKIYQFKSDDREFAQKNLVDAQKANFKRGKYASGGGSQRLLLARGRFKRP